MQAFRLKFAAFSAETPMNNKYKILLVEDEPSIRRYVNALLSASGYTVIEAANCAEAKPCFLSHMPDLVLLDLGLPDGDGMQLLEFIRSRSAVPVIVLSARSDESDKVAALDNGANDYVTKPFGSAELLARMRSALRTGRQHGTGEADNKLCIGALLIDIDARRVFAGETEIKLTQTEYNLLLLLAENRGRMMTYQKVIKAVWGESVNETNIKKLQVNIANIRKKLGAAPTALPPIKNELGVGYRLEG